MESFYSLLNGLQLERFHLSMCAVINYSVLVERWNLFMAPNRKIVSLAWFVLAAGSRDAFVTRIYRQPEREGGLLNSCR